MNQPKFKIGDKVVYKNFYQKNGVVKITGIRLGSCGGFVYNDEGIFEDAIELHQEPQKKKLYAYKVYFTGFENGRVFNGHEVKFLSDVDLEANIGTKGSNDWVRAPDYDINYGED